MHGAVCWSISIASENTFAASPSNMNTDHVGNFDRTREPLFFQGYHPPLTGTRAPQSHPGPLI